MANHLCSVIQTNTPDSSLEKSFIIHVKEKGLFIKSTKTFCPKNRDYASFSYFSVLSMYFISDPGL